MTDAPLPVPVEPQLPAAPGLSQSDLARLAREVAMQMKDLNLILADFKLSEAQYDDLQKNVFFKKVLDTACIEWNSALSTAQRLKIQSQAGLEHILPTLVSRANNKEENLPAAVETGKLLAKLGGIGEAGQQVSSGEKFTININLGDDHKINIIKDVTPKADIDSLPQITVKDPS